MQRLWVSIVCASQLGCHGYYPGTIGGRRPPYENAVSYSAQVPCSGQVSRIDGNIYVRHGADIGVDSQRTVRIQSGDAVATEDRLVRLESRSQAWLECDDGEIVYMSKWRRESANPTERRRRRRGGPILTTPGGTIGVPLPLHRWQ